MTTQLPPGASWWPQYLPYPAAIGPAPGPVPNRTAITWPQSQFAPDYLAPLSPSVQPFNYNKQYDVLYTGGGSPWQTQTPRGEFGGLMKTNPGCGCKNYGQIDMDDPQLKKIAWGYMGLGFVFGLLMCHAHITSQARDLDAEDLEAMR